MRASGTTGDPSDVHRNQRRLGLGIAVAVALGPAAAQALVIGAPGATAKLAYVDPGSGSFILQALVAALAGVAVAISAYWRKIKQLLGVREPERDDPAAETKPGND